MQNIWILNSLFIPCQSSNTLNSSNNCNTLPSTHGLNKHRRRERTSEGLTQNIQRVRDHRSKRLQFQLNSESNNFTLDWAEFMSKDYFQVINSINDCYKKILEIGKCNKVFRPDHGSLPDILTAKSRIDFFKAKKNILLQYNQYLKTGAPRLTISIDVEIVPDPRKYSNSSKPMPSQREILVKEQILEHEFLTENLNIVK
jgi:hypothetical protein